MAKLPHTRQMIMFQGKMTIMLSARKGQCRGPMGYHGRPEEQRGPEKSQWTDQSEQRMKRTMERLTPGLIHC